MIIAKLEVRESRGLLGRKGSINKHRLQSRECGRGAVGKGKALVESYFIARNVD